MNMLDLTGLPQQPPTGRKTTAAPASPTGVEAGAFSQAVAAVPANGRDATAKNAPGSIGQAFPRLATTVLAADGAMAGLGDEGESPAEPGIADAPVAAAPVAAVAAVATLAATGNDAGAESMVAAQRAQLPRVGMRPIGPDTPPPASQAAAARDEPTGTGGMDSRSHPTRSALRAADAAVQSASDSAPADDGPKRAAPPAGPATTAAADRTGVTATAAALRPEQAVQRGPRDGPAPDPGRSAAGIVQALEAVPDIARPKIEAAAATASRPAHEGAILPGVEDVPEAEPAATRTAPAAHPTVLTGPEPSSATAPQASLQVQQAPPGGGAPGAAMPAERAVLHQIATAVVPGTTPGKIDVTLDPPELGRIEIVIELSDQTLKATLSADRHGTGDLIRRHLDLLGDQFRQAGFADVDLSFAENRDGGARQFDHGATEIPIPETPPATEVAHRPVRPALPTSRIDIRL